MPCGDVSEILTIHLNPQEQLVRYTLTKQTCGGAVGDTALLEKWLQNRPAEQIVRLDHATCLAAHKTGDETEAFLLLKHLFAVQSGLAAYLGHESADVQAACAIDTIECDVEGTAVTARLRPDVLADKIERCSGCRKRTPKQKAQATHLKTN